MLDSHHPFKFKPAYLEIAHLPLPERVARLKDPAVRQRLESLNLDPHPGTPQDAAAMLHGDIKRWTEVIAKAGIEKL